MTPKKVKDFIAYNPESQFVKNSYSISGEDILLGGYLATGKYYLDIGCNHPIRFSNTFRFYKQSWTGVCIDASPNFQELYQELRPLDTFINSGVGKAGELSYFEFEENAYNTTNYNVAESVPSKQIRSTRIKIKKLSDILKEIHPNGCNFDFASIDIEGHELEVLKSNDWNLFPIGLILVEIHAITIEEAASHPISLYLYNRGYKIVGKNVNNTLFKYQSSPV